MITRRSFFTEPGEPLIVSPSPVQAAIRFGTWTDFAGVMPDTALVSPMSSVPLPIYPPNWGPGRKRWEGTRPEAMWHPLMWLPPRLAGRYSMVGSDGEPMVESDDLWAVRIAYELMVSGLYEEESGTWLDVLSTIGLNIDEPGDLARVRAWLDGGEDRDLDRLDLTPLLDAVAEQQGDPDWAMSTATDEMDSLRIIAWASSAEALLDHCDDLAQESGEELEEVRRGGALIASLAGVAFAQMPVDGPEDAKPAIWWAGLGDEIEGFAGTARQLLDGPMETMVGRLMEIREVYWPQLERLEQPA